MVKLGETEVRRFEESRGRGFAPDVLFPDAPTIFRNTRQAL
jgi:hypothetical protein